MQKHLTTLLKIRETYITELDNLTLEQMNKIPDTHKNNIIWNAGHTLVVQQLLCYRLSELDCYVTDELIGRYRKGSAPQASVDQTEVDFIKKMLIESVDLMSKDLASNRFQKYKTYTVGFGIQLESVEDAIAFNNIHEGLHYGYLLALKKLI